MSETGHWGRSRQRVWFLLGIATLLGAISSGCSSDDAPSSQESYCEAAGSLRSSVDALVDLDLVAEGTNGLESALDAVREDVANLRQSADEAAGDEVDALAESVQGLEDAVADTGGELSADNVATVSEAVTALATSAQAVEETLTDCP